MSSKKPRTLATGNLFGFEGDTAKVGDFFVFQSESDDFLQVFYPRPDSEKRLVDSFTRQPDRVQQIVSIWLIRPGDVQYSLRQFVSDERAEQIILGAVTSMPDWRRTEGLRPIPFPPGPKRRPLTSQ